jgi:hypothetical protein
MKKKKKKEKKKKEEKLQSYFNIRSSREKLIG